MAAFLPRLKPWASCLFDRERSRRRQKAHLVRLIPPGCRSRQEQAQELLSLPATVNPWNGGQDPTGQGYGNGGSSTGGITTPIGSTRPSRPQGPMPGSWSTGGWMSTSLEPPPRAGARVTPSFLRGDKPGITRAGKRLSAGNGEITRFRVSDTPGSPVPYAAPASRC